MSLTDTNKAMHKHHISLQPPPMLPRILLEENSPTGRVGVQLCLKAWAPFIRDISKLTLGHTTVINLIILQTKSVAC